MASGVDRVELLRELLVWHRRRLTREAVDLPSPLRIRERNHLSQADVAQLTGLGIGVIQRLEAGKGRPDEYVLDAVAMALRMYPDERRTLYELALGHPPAVSRFATDPDAGLALCLDRFRGPAVSLDALFNVLSCNEYAGAWFPGSDSPGANMARWLLHHHHAPHVFVNWSEVATPVVSRLREVAARFPQDNAVAELLDELRTDPMVDRIWREQAGLLYVPMVTRVVLRRPGHTNPRQYDDEKHHVVARLLTLNAPRLDDERRMVAVVFDDPAEPRPDPGGGGGCDACRR